MVEKRQIAEVFPEPVRKLWGEWELRTIILISLALQVTLVLVGGKRKYISSIRLKIFTWSAYLMADWAATVALSVLSTSIQNEDELRTFWAPFLLLHLGGPDTITAFSFADNELWIRHLLGVVVQTFITIYVIIASWRTSSYVSFLSIPMLLSGIIKYGERSWVLRSANQDVSLRELSVRTRRTPETKEKLRVTLLTLTAVLRFSDAALEPAAPEPELPTSGRDVLTSIFSDAHKFFQTFKVLFVDIVTGIDASQALAYMNNRGSRYAFELIRVELGFAYDTFYTKAPVNYTRWGVFSRFFTSALTIIVFVIFSIVVCATSHKFHMIDRVITFVLFGGAIILDIYAFLLLLSSDWTSLWLENRSETWIFKVVSCLSFRRIHKSRWSRSMRQYNLLRFSLCHMPKPTGVLRLIPQGNKNLKNWLTEKMEDVRQLKICTQVSDNLETLIFNHYLEKSRSGSNKKILSTLRGDGVLEKYGLLEELRWTTGVELDHSILIWHIATDICYCADANKSDSIYREMSKQLADYVLYLLVKCPFMLPLGMGMLRFQDTCAEAVHVFKAEDSLEWKHGEVDSSGFRLKLLSSGWNAYAGKSVLTEACNLAKYLEEKMSRDSDKWEMVSNVWVEILGFAANQCRGFYHAEKLAEGGELLTHVWFLMAHFCLTQRFQLVSSLQHAI